MNICVIYFCLFFFLSLCLFLWGLYFVMLDFSLFLEYSLLSVNSSSVVVTFLFDWVSLIFMSFVLLISSMVIFYSSEYMFGDLNLNRFIFLVVLFVISMMFMIISPNLISILLGWDGLGLVSYCLVIYYQNVKSFNAGMLTVLSNRIGDVALLISIAWMLNYGSWNFMFYLDFMMMDFEMSIVMMLVSLAAFTKSAQIPFSSWLPAAMAAPTPVSSLVHSSTLVTAGVYLLIRFSDGFSSNLLCFLLFFSMMTMFMSGLGANYEFDLKKIIALSTLSQLGLMMSILFLGCKDLALFHLLTHALFKALLFMCAGSFIHCLSNCQDIRYMGGLLNQMPLTCLFFCISNFSLCGLPFLSGFYSKDLILEFFSMSYFNFFVYIVFFVSTGLTASYTFRLFYYVLLNDLKFISVNMLIDRGSEMVKGMLGLIIFVVIWGSVLMWVSIPVPYFICLSVGMKFMTLFSVFSGILIGFEVSKMSLNYSIYSLIFIDYSYFFSSMWNLPYISTFGVNFYPLYLGKSYLKIVDQGWFEFAGGQGIYSFFVFLSKFFHFIFSHSLKVYLILFVFWILILYFV